MNDTPTPQAQPTFPVCPHCGADPCEVTMKPYNIPPMWVVGIVSCANKDCRKVLAVVPLGQIMAQPKGGILSPDAGIPPQGFRA